MNEERKTQLKPEQFTVDAALLRELGERLIGRPAIALGELVKNAFDADASICKIEFGKDQIVISDDGTGMAEHDFKDYWMRLGTTHKVDEGKSRKFGRRLTGSKGIGRLSAQFLADEMMIESTSEDKPERSLYAIVDWRDVVRGNNLSTVNVLWDMVPETIVYPADSRTGTRITLKYLKGEWGAKAFEELGGEVWMLRSPFKQFAKGIQAKGAEDFHVEIEAPGIEGAREAFDETFRSVFSNWKARIRGTLEEGRSKGKAVVTVEFREGYPEDSKKVERFRETVQLPVREKYGKKLLIDKVSFEIFVFKPEGRQPGGMAVGDVRDYLATFGNVSVYDAGFRLPYYGSGREDAAGQDWLLTAVDQGRRLAASDLLPEHLRTVNKYMEDLPAPGRIFGAVDIDTNHERAVAERLDKEKVDAERNEGHTTDFLRIQASRDRLVDNDAFGQLHDLVRFSLDFYANRYRLLKLRVAEKNREKEPPSKKYDRAINALESNKGEMPKPVFQEIKREIAEARKASTAQEGAIDRRAALLAPLASAGMVALALNHEISRESTFLNRIRTQLRRLAKQHNIPELGKIAEEFDEAKRRLDSLRELFAPLLTDEDKTATDRLRVRVVVEQVVGAMRVLMPGVKFDCSSIPADLRFPIGSLADWNALLQNVLANAWNAMLDSKMTEISFRGGRDKSGREWLRASDTGEGLGVPLDEAEKLFEPFERRLEISADKRSIAIGGHGLGLAIVRMIARRRSTNVAFVEPEVGFSTTFEISWRGPRK